MRDWTALSECANVHASRGWNLGSLYIRDLVFSQKAFIRKTFTGPREQTQSTPHPVRACALHRGVGGVRASADTCRSTRLVSVGTSPHTPMRWLALLSWAALPFAAPHPHSSSSLPPRVVPSEWTATLTGTVNGTAVFAGLTHKSSARQAVLLSSPGGNSTLWRADLLSIFHIASAASRLAACQREQLFSSEILLLFDFLHAPGTILQGSAVIRGRACNIWFSPFGGPYGKFACLESVAGLPYQRPVRYWLKLEALDFVVDFETDFKQHAHPPQALFAVPAACPRPNVSQPLPLGLHDGFEGDRVAAFWMPPLAKYYTYEPGHISVRRGPSRRGTRAARVCVRPGDVRNAHTERDELDLPMLLVGGRELYYSWSFYLAEDVGVSGNRIVLAHWKQSALFTQSPVFSLRLKRERLVLRVRNVTLEKPDDDDVEFTILDGARRGQWYDVTYGVLFSHEADGFVRVWLDGTEAATFTGPTMSRADDGYFDFHFGVNRDEWNATQTVLLDEFRVEEQPPNATRAGRAHPDPVWDV
jgi:hypothetical protein